VSAIAGVKRIGVVVHPSRDIAGPMRALETWVGDHDAELAQVAAAGQEREVAAATGAADCGLVVSIGGDGTMLSAIRAAMSAQVPVLGIACGSLGVLTTISASDVARALDRIDVGDWSERRLAALAVARPQQPELLALNDVAVVRGGVGQVRTSIALDGVLYTRIAGDGCIVATQLGSAAYTIAAGGPLLAPGTDAFVLTPLATHGGWSPPVVVGAGCELTLDVAAGVGGARLELDGQVLGEHSGTLTITLRRDVATVVSFDDQEPPLAGLRRRGILVDSPRILAEDARR
jgi:NAD+ kinase